MPVKKNHYTEVEGEPAELPQSVRLDMAYDDWLDYNGDKAIRKCVREHGIP